MKKIVKALYKEKNYQRLTIFKPGLNKQHQNDGTITPNWAVVFNVLIKTEPILVKQAVEIGPNKVIIVLYLPECKYTWLLLICDTYALIVKEYFDNELIIAYGSSINDMILVHNYPRKCVRAAFDDLKLISTDEIYINFETNYIINSAVYIEDKKLLYFTTTIGDVFSQIINKSTPKNKISFKLHPHDKILGLKYKQRKRLIIMNTTNHLFILNTELQEIYKFRSNGMPVEIADNENNFIYIYCMGNMNINYWVLQLTKEDVFSLGIKNINTGPFFTNFSSKFLSRLKGISKDESIKKDVYFSHVTKIFYPLELKNQGEIVEFSSSNLEEAKDSCFNTIKIERNLVKLEATEPEIEKDVTGQNFGPILGKSKTQQFEKPVSVENINKNPEIKKNNPVRQINEEKDLFFEGDPNLCKKKCSLCNNRCSKPKEDKNHLCQNPHQCTKPCEKEGICSSLGKICCISIIPAGFTSHEGPHLCDKGFHSCSAKCPIDDCGVYCGKNLRHKGLHKSIIHQNKNDDGCCNEFCFETDHKHEVVCKGGQNCGEITNPQSFKHCFSKPGFDECSCSQFWLSHNWEGIN